jgi:hypothetical protein
MATNYFLVSHKTKTMVFCGARTGIGGARGPMGTEESRVFGAFMVIPDHQGAVLLNENALEADEFEDYELWELANHAELYEISMGEKLYDDASHQSLDAKENHEPSLANNCSRC